jgi:hypothetical protein
MPETARQDLTGVSETYLAPLYGKAMGTQRPNAMVKKVGGIRLLDDWGCFDQPELRLHSHRWIAPLFAPSIQCESSTPSLDEVLDRVVTYHHRWIHAKPRLLTLPHLYYIIYTKFFEIQSAFRIQSLACFMEVAMPQPISLKEAEKKAFITATNDGLWDIFLGCFFLIFVIAPNLSASLGDFWSSFIFLPFWGLVFLGIRLIRKFAIIPRAGVVKFGQARKSRLMKVSRLMLVINILALFFGLMAAVNIGIVPGQMYSITLGLILLVGFSIAAYYLNFNRLYVYGFLIGLAPLVGEWLWTRGYVTHHGFPITFGIVSGIMILVGLAIFVSFLHDNPVHNEEILSNGA